MFGEKARISAVAALAVHTGAALMPTATWFDGDDWGACIYEEVPVPETGTRAEKIAAMSQAMADRFTEAIAEHPQDWHMLQRVFTADLDPDRLGGMGAAAPPGAGGAGGIVPPGSTAMKIGITCPYSWDVPGGVQSHIRDLAEALIDQGPRGVGDLPGRRRHAAAALRDRGRPGGAGALQRVGGAALVRLPVGEPGAALDQGRRVRRAARARARDPEPVPAGLLGRLGPDRRDVPHRDPALPRSAGHLPGGAHRAGEDQRPDRGVRGGQDHAGRAHRRRRRCHPERGGYPPLP